MSNRWILPYLSMAAYERNQKVDLAAQKRKIKAMHMAIRKRQHEATREQIFLERNHGASWQAISRIVKLSPSRCQHLYGRYKDRLESRKWWEQSQRKHPFHGNGHYTHEQWHDWLYKRRETYPVEWEEYRAYWGSL